MMKTAYWRYFIYAVVFLCVIGLPAGMSSAVNVPENFSGGSGSADDPYLIATADDLAGLSARIAEENGEKLRYRSAYYLQTEDIDISSIQQWVPIGTSKSNVFGGVYDGNDFKITNIRKQVYDNDYQSAAYGLFGVVSGDYQELGVLRNIRMDNSVEFFISLSESNARTIILGGIAGELRGGKILGCTAEGAGIRVVASESLLHNLWIGGLVGRAEDSIIHNCVNNSPIHADSQRLSSVTMLIGGVAGTAGLTVRYSKQKGSKSIISGSRNNGLIEAAPRSGNIGGIVGNNYGDVLNCRNTGSINVETEQSANCGGIIGESMGGSRNMTIARCFNEGRIRASVKRENGPVGIHAGGIVGESSLGLSKSINAGEIIVKVDYENLSGEVKFDNGSYTEYYSVDVKCGGLVGNLNLPFHLPKRVEDSVNMGDIMGIISSKGLPTNICIGGAVGYCGLNYDYYEVHMRNLLNSGHVRVGVLPPEIGSSSGSIIGNLNFRRMNTKESTIANCYWLEGTALKGIGNDNQKYNITEGATTKLTHGDWSNQESFKGLDFEKVWVMSDTEPKTPVLRYFDGKK